MGWKASPADPQAGSWLRYWFPSQTGVESEGSSSFPALGLSERPPTSRVSFLSLTPVYDLRPGGGSWWRGCRPGLGQGGSLGAEPRSTSAQGRKKSVAVGTCWHVPRGVVILLRCISQIGCRGLFRRLTWTRCRKAFVLSRLSAPEFWHALLRKES